MAPSLKTLLQQSNSLLQANTKQLNSLAVARDLSKVQAIATSYNHLLDSERCVRAARAIHQETQWRREQGLRKIDAIK
jgi:hypothetical protein